MQIRDLDPAAQSDVDGWLEVARSAVAVDIPDLPPVTRQDFVGELAMPWPAQRTRYQLAELDGRIVGLSRLEIQEVDNKDNIDFQLTVHPAFRRRGIGSTLHRLAVGQARQAGGRRLMTESVRALPGGEDRDGAGSLFYRQTGAKLGQTDVRSRADVSTLDRTALPGRCADLSAQATGYTLTSWSGDTPDDVVAGLAELDSRFLAEAPLGDLAWEPQQVDVARIRAGERCQAVRGHLLHHTVVRHDGTGELVGWTALLQREGHADYLEQGVTLVLPEHRGHRLGMLLKYSNLRLAWAALPGLRWIDTWNAEENKHMIGINESMGFRPVDAWDAWQLEL